MTATNEQTMSLAKLVVGAGGSVSAVELAKDVALTSIEYDSRKVRQGSLFVALRGLVSDGHDFIADAVNRGAVALVVERSRLDEFRHYADRGLALLAADDSRRALALLSASFEGHPSRDMVVVGVTGTNGKTSITYMLESVLTFAGIETGVIGTVNYRWKGRVLDAPNTTPQSRDLQRLLAMMRDDGVRAVIMEVSSHALELGRADGIDFDAAVFTNLTGDHLDFHGDLESFFRAKKRIFDLLQASSKGHRFGVVNVDDEYGVRIMQEKDLPGYPLYGMGFGPDADFRPVRESVASSIGGLRYTLEKPLSGFEIRLALAGHFQVYNSLAAFAVARNLGLPYHVISRGLLELFSIPGRFDVIPSKLGFSAIVDYAHTPDALLKLLQSVARLSPKRIITVFGCGGDRDRGKRPLMGSIAAQHSDYLIITSDNPRSEDPGAIIDDIVSGIGDAACVVVSDRKEAIARAIEEAREGDLVVVAGKGHEDYQIIGAIKTHFDDREVARLCIRHREAS